MEHVGAYCGSIFLTNGHVSFFAKDLKRPGLLLSDAIFFSSGGLGPSKVLLPYECAASLTVRHDHNFNEFGCELASS